MNIVKQIWLIPFYTIYVFGQIDSARYYYVNLRYNDAITFLKSKIEKNSYKSASSKTVDLYNLACSYALAKDYNKSIAAIKTMLKHDTSGIGFYYDKDFYNLSQTKEWDELVLNFRKRNNIQSQLKDEDFLNLSKLAIRDQALYNEIDYYEKKYGRKSKLVKKIWDIKDSLGKNNLQMVRSYLSKNFNILSDSVVGRTFASKAFLVIQHSTYKDMETYLPIIKDLYEKGHTKGENYALLYDRVSLPKTSGKQYYGTQINTELNQPYQIIDEKNVDIRRAKLGMIPLAEYLLNFNINYKPK